MTDFEMLKQIIENVKQIKVNITDIEMLIDNNNTKETKMYFKDVYKLCDNLTDLEKEIYYKHLI